MGKQTFRKQMCSTFLHDGKKLLCLAKLRDPYSSIYFKFIHLIWIFHFFPFADLLIDISDVQQICSYELGRTYLKLSNALCINIPSVGKCKFWVTFIFLQNFRLNMEDKATKMKMQINNKDFVKSMYVIFNGIVNSKAI